MHKILDLFGIDLHCWYSTVEIDAEQIWCMPETWHVCQFDGSLQFSSVICTIYPIVVQQYVWIRIHNTGLVQYWLINSYNLVKSLFWRATNHVVVSKHVRTGSLHILVPSEILSACLQYRVWLFFGVFNSCPAFTKLTQPHQQRNQLIDASVYLLLRLTACLWWKGPSSMKRA